MKYSPTGRLITSLPLAGSKFAIGRQPILDLNQDIFGYELLFRDSTENYINVMDGDLATLTVFFNTISVAGLNAMVGSRKAFFNVTRNFLIGRFPIPIAPDRIVLEVQQDFDFDRELIHAMRELSVQGYQIAIDGVTSTRQIPPLDQINSFAKVNIAELEPIVLPRLVRELKEKSIRPIAEKVETREEYEQCRQVGFEFFQGFYLHRPEVIQGRKIHASRPVILKILSALNNPAIRIEDLEYAFSSDITIAYCLLKLINSGYYHNSRIPVASIRQAILLIGLDRIKNWLNLLLLANPSNEIQPLSIRALVRAKMAASLALELKVSHPDSCFMAGLFSVLDIALDLPMGEVLEGISLTPETTLALTTGEGQVGDLLKAIAEAEKENWAAMPKFNIEPEMARRLYLEANRWAESKL